MTAETSDEHPAPLPPTTWQFPHASQSDEHGVVGVGGDLEPATVIHAYKSGLFPMPIDDADNIAWWSPPERGVLDFSDLKISKSLRRSCRRYETTVNAAFDDVIDMCSELPRDGGWISPKIVTAYKRLHRLGWAHSVETWQGDDLVGGLYGVQIRGLFAGESMFHLATDASKVALVSLVASLRSVGVELLDVQWSTDHLATLGVRRITRREYLHRLNSALLSQASPLSRLSGQNIGHEMLETP